MTRRASTEACSSLSHVAKTALLVGAALAGFSAQPALAGPTGAHVVHGNVTIEQRGNRTIIRAGDGSIINFKNFNIAQGEVVRFIQPGELSRVLNRITGGEASIISGRLLANGNVYLVNPAGVLFNNGSVVQVTGLFAAAGSLGNARFLSGTDRFTNLNGSVINNGSIRGDSVSLVGKNVANNGSITSPRGIVAMAAGNDVLIQQNGEHISIKIDGAMLTNQSTPSGGSTTADMTANPGVENTGTVNANHGQAFLGAGDMYSLAVRNSGSVTAAGGNVTVAASDGLVHNTATGSISTDVTHGQAGDVVVQAPSVLNSGAITANANDGRAGSVEVTSQNHTYLTDGSMVSASGGAGEATGGEVLVHSYDGSTVVADGATVSVAGGMLGGDGGFAEISGKNLTFNGQALLTGSSDADPGMLLIDPRNIFITDTGGDDAFLNDGVINFGEGLPNQDFAISDEALEAIVGDILLQALRDIFVMQRVDFVNGNNLRMEAGRSIAINRRLTGLHDLEVMAAMTDPIGQVFVNAPLSLTGKGVFDGSRIFLNCFTIDSTDGQEYLGPVDICVDMTLTGTSVQFLDTVDATFPGQHGLTVRITDDSNTSDFLGAVGGVRELRFLRVEGDSNVDGGVVTTRDFQTYLGHVELGNDTVMTSLEAGDIRFGQTLDGAHHLFVSTAGLTRFDGEVGGDTPLTSVTTDFAGETQIGGDMTASSFVEINDPARLVSDVTIDATDRVQFTQTLDGDADGDVAVGPDEDGVTGGTLHDLTINSALTFFGGNVDGLDHLVTDREGTTFIGLLFGKDEGNGNVGDVSIIANDILFNDHVQLLTNGVVTGFESLDFDRTVNGEFALEAYSNQRVRFGSNVGAGTGGGELDDEHLTSLTVSILDRSILDQNVILFDGHKVFVENDILLNEAGRTAPAQVASIALRNFGGIVFRSFNGNMFMGRNEKMTSMGSLRFDIPNGTLTVGDLNAWQNLQVDALNVVIWRRDPGNILNHQGQFVPDNGTTIVVGGEVDGDVGSLSLTGAGANPVFASKVISNLQGPAADFVKRVFAALTQANFTFQGTVLDLAPPQFGQDLGPAFAFAPTKIKDRIFLDPFALRDTGNMAISMREMTPNELRDTVTGRELYNDTVSQAGQTWADQAISTTRLRRTALLNAMENYDGTYYAADISPETGEPVLDENGQPKKVDQAPFIKKAMDNAWNGYQAQLAAAPSEAKPTFIAYLQQAPEEEQALVYAQGLRNLLVDLRTTGLTSLELDRSQEMVLKPVSPTADWQTFRDALLAGPAEAQPAQARSEKSPVNAG